MDSVYAYLQHSKHFLLGAIVGLRCTCGAWWLGLGLFLWGCSPAEGLLWLYDVMECAFPLSVLRDVGACFVDSCGVSLLHSKNVRLPVICLLHKLQIHTGPGLEVVFCFCVSCCEFC